VLTVWELSGFGVSLGLFPVWFFVGVAWLVRVSVRLGPRRLPKRWRHVAVVPVVGLAVAILAATSGPFRVRFALSRQSMDAFAHQVAVAPKGSTWAPRQVGLWHASTIERLPHGGMRYLVGHCVLDECGFAYSPRGYPPNLGGEDIYTHLDGPWYFWRQSW